MNLRLEVADLYHVARVRLEVACLYHVARVRLEVAGLYHVDRVRLEVVGLYQLAKRLEISASASLWSLNSLFLLINANTVYSKFLVWIKFSTKR